MTPQLVKGALAWILYKYVVMRARQRIVSATRGPGAKLTTEEDIQGLYRQIANEEMSARMLIALMQREFRGPPQMLDWKIRDKQSHVDASVRLPQSLTRN